MARADSIPTLYTSRHKPGGELVINNEETTTLDGDLRVEFVKKGDFDNPKVCAIALMKGTPEGGRWES